MTPRFLILIPVYNHPNTIISVVQSCLEYSEYNVLIVDDGSDQKIFDLFQSTEDNFKKNPRIILLAHELNQGKGAALQTGFLWARKNNYTHVITLDADGQHFPEDIPKLVRRSEKHPYSLILGDREMKGPHIPNSSQFGKKFSNFWVQFETDKTVGDSQSGFRIYPLIHIQNLQFLSRHYDFEVEVITRLLWKGVEVENVKVQVEYQQGSDRITHFNKWRDNFRLTVLNTILVTLSMLKAKRSPLVHSMALGLGVLVGATPFYGFHTLIVALLALFLRLNVIIMWVGTQVSLPPFIPFLVLSTKIVYNSVFDANIKIEDYTQVLTLGSRWIYSSLILGTILGFIAAIAFYLIQKSRERSLQIKEPSTQWSKKSRSHLGIWFVQKLMEWGGIKAAYGFLYLIVPFYFINPRIRKSLNEYWKSVKPEFSFWQRQRGLFLQLLSFAQNLVDRAFQRTSSKYTLNMIKDENLNSFLNFIDNPQNKKPCILIGTHFGGWELAMTAFNHIAMKRRMLVIMHQADQNMNHHSTTQKNRENFEIMYFNKASFSIMKIKDYLSKGDIVALMGDRPVGRSQELISFCNKLCLFDSTAFRLAEMLKAQIFYLFCVKEDVLKYRVSISKSKIENNELNQDSEVLDREVNNYNNKIRESSFDSRQNRVVFQMQEYVQNIEEYVQKYPEQWMNFFPFFSFNKNV